ncbi:deoxyribonuclease IV [Planctomicrobium piriforme]|uniref:Probable endonuclease 4 n=1 Tax=Planctomicrobium piriforme TaxID=1576369 RepID=A0A1I3NLE1_9PLAN|nr:deoxyribonuclease IV [Planctomicrobium piriforme]SFJ09586.1 deoxyribonuclease-4 [Planctomicrobium piriforme]
MPFLGSHLSISGGYYKAADAAAAYGMGTVQIFTKNNNQWRAKELSDEEIRAFQTAVREHKLQVPCAHDSYLINLASGNDELWEKSLEAFVIELERAEALGLAGVVMHPGSYVDTSEEAGLARIVTALDEVHRRTAGFKVGTWLEVTAGQGTNLGYKFEHLGEIISKSKQPERFGVCLDSCHLFAAGYGLKTKTEYKATMQQLDEHVGIDRVRAWHLNDSKKGQGSRVDRHEHIGEGCIGVEAFGFILNDPKFKKLPMYLETKKEKRDGEEMDAVNLRVLQSLMAKKA